MKHVVESSLKNSKNPVGSRIVDAAVSKHKDLPNQALARIVFKRHPLVFPTLDSVITAIRYRRGAMGNHKRKQGVSASVPPTPRSKFNASNPLGLPDSAQIDVKPTVVSGVERALILNDLHFPYHDVPAITAALNYGLDKKCDAVILNGDIVDFHTISHYQKDPEARSFKEERDSAKAFLARLRALFPNATIIYKEGNHDERLGNFVRQKAVEIYDEDVFGLVPLFGLSELGIQFVNRKSEILLGKLTLLHGHELPKGMTNSVNPARGAFLRTTATVAVGHHHRTSKHTEMAMGGKLIGCWSIGCLCSLRPLFEPNNKWNHGCAVVDLKPNGDFNFDNVTIHRGEVL